MSKKVIFKGAVFAGAGALTIRPALHKIWRPTQGVECPMTISVVDSRVEVTCEVDGDPAAQLGELYVSATRFARTLVDVASFERGVSFHARLQTVALPDAYVDQPLNLADERLVGISPAFHDSTTWAVEIAMSDTAIADALNDLNEALAWPPYTAINAHRAVERVRHLLAPPGADAPTAWAHLRNVLNISRPYVQLVNDASTNPRHGRHVPITETDFAELKVRAWTVLNRYFEYRKRGDQPLPLDEFPLL
jgi:hypothetical protein